MQGKQRQGGHRRISPEIPKHRLSSTSSTAANCITRHVCPPNRAAAALPSNLRCDFLNSLLCHSPRLRFRSSEPAAGSRGSPRLHELRDLSGSCRNAGESSRLAGRNTMGKVKEGRRRFVIVTHLLTMAATRKCYGKPVRKSADIQRARQQGAGTLTPEAMPSPRTRAQAVSGCGGKGHASHHQTPSRGLLLTLPLFLIFTSCSSARAMAHASKIAW
jgi:hypothetical protein